MEQENTLQQNRLKKFLRAIGLYAIGNIGSRLITFLMIPLYTYFVEPSDLGLYDISLSLIITCIPIFTLQLRDGAFRFLIDNNNVEERRSVVSFVGNELMFSTFIALIVAILLYCIYTPTYLVEIFLLLLVMSYYEVFAQVARAIDGAGVFANSSLICSLGIGLFSVLFVFLFEWGLRGIFFANIVARMSALLYIFMKIKIYRFFRRKSNKNLLRQRILGYVLPLLPGALCWCILDCCGRIFLERSLGLEISGIFAVSVRFSSIIYTFAVIFIQAWQETAIVNYKTKDRDSFFSEIFNSFIYYVSIIIVMLNFVLKLCYGCIVDLEYSESLLYIFPLTIGTGFCVLSHFLDLGYQCSKETKRALPSLACAVVVNFLCNMVFINTMGVWSPIIANLLSYFVMSIYRFYDVKKYFHLLIYKSSLFLLFVVAISIYMFYTIQNPYIDVAYILLLAVIFVIMLPPTLANKLKRNFNIKSI